MPLARRKAREASGTLAVLVAVLAAAALVACEQPAGLNEPTPTVSSLMVSPQAITLLPNQVADFMAVGFTSTGDTAQMSVTWSVTSGAITDTASNGGRHYGHYKAGSDTGTFKVVATGHPGGKTADATVTVTAVPVASAVVTPAVASVPVGGAVQLTATTKDSAGNVLTGRRVTWASSNTAVATTSGSGLVTAVAAGVATITATSEGKNGMATVTVTASSGGGPITDPGIILTVPMLAKSAFLAPLYPTPFNLKVMRIVGDSGTPFTMTGGGSGTWGSDARHHYSDDQPWNADGTLLMLQNSGSPSDLVLDGNTYQVISGGCNDGGYGRWHPSLTHAYERVKAYGTELWWYDIRTCGITRRWSLPFAATGDIEMGPSRDGRFMALSNATQVFVADMDPQPPFAPYPSQRLGPVYDFSNCGAPSGCTLDFTQVSASGRYVIVHFQGDWQQVLDVDPNTLALTPRAMPAAAPRCTGTAAQGFTYDLGHPDVTLNPFDNNEDVIIGQEHCGNIGKTVNGRLMGGVVMVRLRDGAVTPLTDPSNEAYPYHISARNFDRPGWVYVAYWPSPGKRFSDELVAVKLDGSGSVERYAHTHSDSNAGGYRAEPHGVPARDGRRILWASNWMLNATGGSASITQAYVVDAR